MIDSGVASIRGRTLPTAPYTDFLAAARRHVESKGLRWEIPRDQRGKPLSKNVDWDLRVLTGSHAKHSSRLGSFEMDHACRALAADADWAPATLPEGSVLCAEVEDFIKAVCVHRCRASMEPRITRHLAKGLKTFFSTSNKMPWEINSEDIQRFERLRGLGDRSLKAVQMMVRAINENLLSEACPLSVRTTTETAFDWKDSLDERAHAQKLPKLDALYELVRIIFQEKPLTFNDTVQFFALRVMVLTGLRLNEVLMLPADCLRWEDHLDVVTGKPAEEVGGISRSLRLRHFALKQDEGLPDLLVEEDQWVPTRFHAAIADAVNLAIQATAEARSILLLQHANPDTAPPQSDLRRFKTTAGNGLTTADLLFLQVPEDGRPLPSPMPADFPVFTLLPNRIYGALGLTKDCPWRSFFVKYGSGPDVSGLSVRPHSLRHLLNTELFRQGVPDTAITQQFGRTTVTQSYVYDHRSLGEKLAFVELPKAATDIVNSGTPQELVAKMVVGGLVPKSHIARSFEAIRAKDGDVAAFRYLVANSDGFHVTPYGFCVNSFSMNPCARHLKCFDLCKHFTASGLPEHRVTLESLKQNLREMRSAAAAKPANTVGRRNQIAHADSLLAGVEAALAASPSTPVFAHGVDHSLGPKDVLS